MTTWPVHGRISGPIVMIGFGSIGRGTLPLIERHFAFDRNRFVVIDPEDADRALLDERGIRFIQSAVTRDNYRGLLRPLLTEGGGQGFCVNLSVDVSSLAIMELCRELERALYRYRDGALARLLFRQIGRPSRALELRAAGDAAGRAPRETGRDDGGELLRGQSRHGVLVRQAGAGQPRGRSRPRSRQPDASREAWAALMRRVGVKGIHIAERDTQRAKTPKPRHVFVNTWSVEGFVSEGLQPAELGWGSFEGWMPENGRRHEAGCGAAIYLLQPGANTRVRSWTPTAQAQYGFLVTHNEAISIADYYTVRDGAGGVAFRPTCHYAYHPADDAVLSLHEMFGQEGERQPDWHILDENEIVDGIDELGVLLYGHGRNAYWYGSQLSIEETRRLAPYQNATGLQVTSAVLAGMVWALENPEAGIVEADEMDYRRCLEIQMPYLGPVIGAYTDWTPLKNRPGLFPEDIDASEPWAFRNVLVR